MLHVVLSFFLTIELVVLTDFCLVLFGRHFKLRYYGLSVVVLFALLVCIRALDGLMGVTCISIVPVFVFLMYLLWRFAFRDVKLTPVVDHGKKSLFSNKRVMVIVPHQDDEINVLGGVFEEYIKYGSELFLVYAITNGRVSGFRYDEAIDLCCRIGIPKDHVIFLGYGSLRDKGDNLPNRTMGTLQYPAFREGQAYSRVNMVTDLEEIIKEKRPDVIYGSDYDYHIDHHLVTIAIDEALGRVLKSAPNYRPIIVKCYAYRTTWEAYPDYYKDLNLGSTRYMSAPVETYSWEERLRLPISANMLCRSLLKSQIFQQYAIFRSQGAVMRAVNYKTDKVGWERRTDSLLLSAQVTTSSGDGSKLNDFLLYDKAKMTSLDELPLQGTWVTDENDLEQKATFTWEQPIDILYVDIYNNPSQEHHVKKVCLSFVNGQDILVDLEPDHPRTRVYVHQKGITQWSLQIMEKQGRWAGITEVEAFEDDYQSDFSFVKWTNGNGDFLYDYWTPANGQDKLKIYANGLASDVQEWQVDSSNELCLVTVEQDMVSLSLPRGKHTLLTVKSSDGVYSDTIELSNPSLYRRIMTKVGQKIESVYYDIFVGDYHRKATTLSIMAYCKNKLK